KVGLRIPVAKSGERFAFEWVVLAAVAGELKWAEAVAERLVEAAGANGRKLRRIADQEQFPLRAVDGVEERGEHARLRHPRLIHHQHAAMGEAAVTPGVEEKP